MNKIKVVNLLLLIIFSGCTLNDSNLKNSVTINFSYFRANNDIALGLFIYYTGKEARYLPRYYLDFYDNDNYCPQKAPIQMDKYTLRKMCIPDSPKQLLRIRKLKT